MRVSEIVPSGATLTGPADRVAGRRHERAGRVVGVEQLEARVEAELGRDDRQAQVAGQRRVEARARSRAGSAACSR